MKRLASWARRVRAVGEAFLDVWRAELVEIAADLGRSGRALVRALALLAAAAAVGFWVLGLMLYFAVELVALVLPRWGAVGVVLAVFLLVAAILLVVGRRRLAAIETPAATLRRRFDDHRRWWRENVAADDEPGEDEE
jgi:hypothetical protein